MSIEYVSSVVKHHTYIHTCMSNQGIMFQDQTLCLCVYVYQVCLLSDKAPHIHTYIYTCISNQGIIFQGQKSCLCLYVYQVCLLQRLAWLKLYNHVLAQLRFYTTTYVMCVIMLFIVNSCVMAQLTFIYIYIYIYIYMSQCTCVLPWALGFSVFFFGMYFWFNYDPHVVDLYSKLRYLSVRVTPKIEHFYGWAYVIINEMKL